MPSLKLKDIKGYFYNVNPVTILKLAFQALIFYFGISHLVDLIIDRKATPQTLDLLVRFVYAMVILEVIARISIWVACKLPEAFRLMYLFCHKFLNNKILALKGIKGKFFNLNPVMILKWSFQALLCLVGIFLIGPTIVSAGFAELATMEMLDTFSRFVFAIVTLEIIARITISGIHNLVQFLKLS